MFTVATVVPAIVSSNEVLFLEAMFKGIRIVMKNSMNVE
jgi:hypothetical protein